MHSGLPCLRCCISRRMRLHGARSSADSVTHTAHSPHLNTHESGSPPQPGIVRARYVGLPQFGHGGRTVACLPLSRGNSVASIIPHPYFIKRLIEIQTNV